MKLPSCRKKKQQPYKAITTSMVSGSQCLTRVSSLYAPQTGKYKRKSSDSQLQITNKPLIPRGLLVISIP